MIGGGIIGLATARELLQRGVKSVTVLEAEPALAQHQTGRNSGVVHAGIYYPPGSLKARLCREGLARSYAYFEQKGIPHRRVGKLIVALREHEVPRLRALYANALTNQVPGVAFLDSPAKLRAVEPECAGVAAIHSPNTGIVDWGVVAHHFADDVRGLGGRVEVGARVAGLREADGGVCVYAGGAGGAAEPRVVAERVVSCAGAQADRVAALLGGAAAPQIVPVRGEYLRVANAAVAARIRGNIYPLPAARGAPFLGVHFTRTMADEVIVGPNAVLALAREGYGRADVRLADVAQMVAYRGFWRLCWRHARFGLREMYRSVFLSAAAAAAREYVPALEVGDFERRGPDRSGIRGQAVSADGELVDDFVFETAAGGRVLHTRNAPSPGATSSLAIASMIVDRSFESFGESAAR